MNKNISCFNTRDKALLTPGFQIDNEKLIEVIFNNFELSRDRLAEKNSKRIVITMTLQ